MKLETKNKKERKMKEVSYEYIDRIEEIIRFIADSSYEGRYILERHKSFHRFGFVLWRAIRTVIEYIGSQPPSNDYLPPSPIRCLSPHRGCLHGVPAGIAPDGTRVAPSQAKSRS